MNESTVSLRARPAHPAGLAVLALTIPLITGCPQVPMPGPDGNGDGGVERVALQLVADGFTSPVALVQPDDGSGRLFVVDQTGTIRIIDADGNLLPEPFLDLTAFLVTLMTQFDERGLLSLAFHPDYAVNGRFFVFYTAPRGTELPEEFNAQSHVSEFAVSDDDPNRADPGSERILMVIPKPQFNHNGGQLAFGPDGLLYIGVGDGGGGNDVGFGHTPGLGNGQDTTNVLGTILRIDVDATEPFDIPPDNPFLDDPESPDEIWAWGFRNPWRFSFDLGGDNELFVGDAGQDLFEEVSMVTGGNNYGWNIKEGTHCFDPDDPGNPPDDCPELDADGNPLIDPIIEYAHFDDQGNAIGIVVIGGYVYRGDDLPDLVGDYVFGDFSRSFQTPDGTLFAATRPTSGQGLWPIRELSIADRPDGRLGRFILGFGQDLDGEVYILTTENAGPTGNTGAAHRLVAPPEAQP